MGKVFLVGAGPGDPELLTRKAARLLAEATIVLHDALVSREVLALISPRAECIDVGKRFGQKLLTQDEINSLLISYAASHEIIVRLKGGDPLIFGRAAEEMLALREAAIDFEVVPGITAALAAAASARISLTYRRVAFQLLFTTFSRAASSSPMDWSAVTTTTTLVIYMPGPDYPELSRWLQDSDLPADLPCAVISKATHPDQQLFRTTIAALAEAAKLPAPALLLVGRVAAQPSDTDFTAASGLLHDSLPGNLRNVLSRRSSVL
jgi:uroporphyrin-III C-methyltransferase